MIKVGIIGGMSYSAGELLRLLVNHPDVEIEFIHSECNAGNEVTSMHSGLYGETQLRFTDELPLDKVDVLFLCTKEGEAKQFMETQQLPEDLKIIDLSMDHRMKSEENDFLYGLPELNRRAICHSQHVSNPGALATCVSLALLPLAKHLLLNTDIAIHAVTSKLEADGMHSSTPGCCNQKLSVYSPFTHPQLPEILQALQQMQNSFSADLNLIPCRGDFHRGIFATIVMKCRVGLDELMKMYRSYYEEDSFVHITSDNINLDQVINTNKCLIHLAKQDDKLLIVSCIDDLLKGASGQAVHNMNLMFNLEETVGLRLKSSAF